MIPFNTKLYTWIDVREVFLKTLKANESQQYLWPDELIWVRIYIDRADLGIKENSVDRIKQWLFGLFESRFDINKNTIFLEDENNSLEVSYDELEEDFVLPNKKPILEANKIISREKEYALPEQKDYPQLFAFHSFKGGVGRTLHSIAFAKKLNDSKKKVLLIDGDFEAPGISYLMFNESSPDISYKDLLALVHSDVDDKGLNAIKFVADRILSQVKENIFILPAFRNEENLLSLEIKPIDLTNNFSNPYILSEIIFLLGKSLNVDVVIVDLRAGLSELSSGLLLDPRVEKILVSSYSEQSLKGIEQVLKLLKERHTKEIGKNPSLILTQIPDNELKDVDKLFKKKYNLSSAFFGNKNIYDNEEPLDFELKFIESPFNQELVVLPLVWDEVIAKIKKSNLDHTISNLIEYHNIPSILGTKQNYDYQNLRKQLKEKTEKMIFAESGEVENFLWTKPLQNIAKSFSHKMPFLVVIGAKGAGKTLIFMQLLRKKYWQQFLESHQNKNVVDELLLPVLKPDNLQSRAKEIFDQCLINTRSNLKLNSDVIEADVRDYIRENLNYGSIKNNLTETNWREIWLNAIALMAGFKPDIEKDYTNLGRNFISFLKQEKKKVVAVFDGIEDLFQDKDAVINNTTALRGLIQQLPDWLEQQLDKPLGIIVLIRQDYVNYAIEQNLGQFEAKYSSYQLKWDQTEALKLIIYILNEILNDKIKVESFEDSVNGKDNLISSLHFLWGQKLGTETSNNAYSANWIMSALSDWKNQIQARDLVRFLFSAAEKSEGDTKWSDRIITPTSAKNALEFCSTKKVEEVGKENKSLKDIFDILLGIETDKKTPFSISEFEEQLPSAKIKILEENGVIYKYEEEYHIAEIYRLGLKFKYKGRKMSKTLSIRKSIG